MVTSTFDQGLLEVGLTLVVLYQEGGPVMAKGLTKGTCRGWKSTNNDGAAGFLARLRGWRRDNGVLVV